MAERKDDALRNLFQQVGHAAPATDLTGRIMARVAVTPILRPAEVKPLIGRWGWLAIAACSAIVPAVLLSFGSGAPSQIDRTLGQYLPQFQLPQVAWTPWLMMVSGCLLLFAVIDRALAWRRTAGQ